MSDETDNKNSSGIGPAAGAGRNLTADAEEIETPLHWYIEQTALFVTTLKWAVLGSVVGITVGLATKLFLWILEISAAELGRISIVPYLFLPLALPLCVFLIRFFAPDAKGHGTEAVIKAVHENYGKIKWQVAPIKLIATVLTIATGGSVGKEGPCAQIGAAVTSLFADLLRLPDADRRRLVICGISAGFAAVFGTPVSGALFGVEVLYLGRIEYSVLFPSLLAGILAHVVCNVPPPMVAAENVTIATGQFNTVLITLALGSLFGLIALLFIEMLEYFQRRAQEWKHRPYALAFVGGSFLAIFYFLFGDIYSGLGTATIEQALAGSSSMFVGAALLKMIATSITLEVGGSGGIITPLFFIGTASGAVLAQMFGFPVGVIAGFGFLSLLGASTNTPIAAAVMGMEILPGPIGVYGALCVCTAYLIVGHRSVYNSQKIGFIKSAGLDFTLDVPIGEITAKKMRLKKGSLTDRLATFRPQRSRKKKK